MTFIWKGWGKPQLPPQFQRQTNIQTDPETETNRKKKEGAPSEYENYPLVMTNIAMV